MDINDEDIKALVEKYGDPTCAGLVNYLNLHHDVVAVHNHVRGERVPKSVTKERNVDLVPLFVS